ncbi:MAG: D-alanyl-D-alanine carboxypeptidase/D-alanyl-D-alanine-endopeptidase [Burkholderiales bacterium]|nr:D-alanyl-D-alanine carboxypeptidase/D-alanyl-D-alanine-endopeptidase [Burkholderiales bacterium]
MKLPRQFFIVVLLFQLPLICRAQEPLPSGVYEAFRRAGIPTSAVGIHVQDVSVDKPLLASNATVPMSPASIMKLVTTNAALELLGPTFTWKTQAYVTGTQSGDVLHGDLIFKGSGDPKLVMENFWLFLRRIRAAGIREIRGNVVLDRSAFADVYYDSSKFDGDPAKPYNAGPDAMLVNFKALSFRFIPNASPATVSVVVDPPVAGFPIIAPKLGNGDCGDWKQKLRLKIDSTVAEFSGVYSAACGEKVWHIHPFQITHGRYFDMVFRQMWADVGGALKGEIKNGMTPADARLVAQWESTTLPEVIRDINKFSNNVMARQLLLTLAAQLAKQPATVEDATQVIRNWLSAKRIDVPELAIENGSGLSRTERITSNTLGRILVAAFRSPLMPEFISSMPLAGYDGTMRSRVKQKSVAGNAHIKTGSLNDVRSMAGYVLAASGKRYAVVCIVNHVNAARSHDAQDALLQWVYENG